MRQAQGLTDRLVFFDSFAERQCIGNPEAEAFYQKAREFEEGMFGFKSFASASATLEGIEVANMIRKGQLTPRLCPFAKFAALAA